MGNFSQCLKLMLGCSPYGILHCKIRIRDHDGPAREYLVRLNQECIRARLIIHS